MAKLKREPIFWMHTSEPDRQNPERERIIVRAAKKIREKFPQHGHEGDDYEDKKKARGVRFIYVIRHEGHEVPLILTNAAAHLDPSTGYGNYARRKARHLGWYPTAACPVALLRAGEFDPECFVLKDEFAHSPSCSGQFSRQHPCPHSVAERGARIVQWNAEQAERLAAFKSDAEKVLEDTRKANREGNSELIRALFVEFMPHLIEQIQGGKPIAGQADGAVNESATAPSPAPAVPPHDDRGGRGRGGKDGR